MKIRQGDRVVVRSGKYRGATAEVVRAMPKEGKVVLEGVNVARRHQKPTRAIMQGGVIDKFMPLPVSDVAIVCPTCGPSRIGYRFDEEGAKVRVCKKCGADL
jgi:large subunit ribosomal protein L24